MRHMQVKRTMTRIERTRSYQKIPDNLDAGSTLRHPPRRSDVHHEAELSVRLNSGAENIPVYEAPGQVCGHAVTHDITRSGLRNTQRRLRRQMEIAMAFEQSCPVSRTTAGRP